MPDFCHFSAASLREGPCLCSNKVQAHFILGLLPASEFNITFGTVPATFRWSSQDVELNMATLAWNPRAWGPSKPWDSGSDRAKAPVFLATSPSRALRCLVAAGTLPEQGPVRHGRASKHRTRKR